MRSTKLHVDAIRKLLMAGATSRLDRMLARLRPADLANLFGELSPGETRALVEVLFTAERAGITMRELPREILPEVLEVLEDQRIAKILERVEPDDAASFLFALDEERRGPVLELVAEPRQQELRWHLLYPEESAGSVMTPRVMVVHPDDTAEQAIEMIRKQGDKFEAASYLYVIDVDRHLLGVVPLRRLIAASPDQPMRQLMVADPVSVNAWSDREEAAKIVSRYNLLSLPVVDEQLHLLGIITVDDVIDIIQEEATEDFYRMAGLSGDDRVFSPIGRSMLRRYPWMLLNLGTALLAALVVGLFQNTIAQLVSLAVFMPVVAGMGGNGGIQALTVMTRGIALGELEFARVSHAFLKELTIGLAIGAGVGALTALLQYLWQGNLYLGLVLFLAMVINMVTAGVMGVAVPLFLRAIGRDPAMGAGVIVTTFTDVVGFFTFLGLATLMLSYFQ